MHIDELTLRAYVDGELSLAECGRVEAALAHSSELSAQIESMRASVLPYRAAFDAQVVPAVPFALQQRVASLSAAAQSGFPDSLNSSRLTGSASRTEWFSREALRRGFRFGAGLAAAFVAGIVLHPVWFAAAPGAGDSQNAPWVQAIASYQALYVRDTVGRTADTAEQAQQVLANFQQQTQGRWLPKSMPKASELSVPNLSAAGFDFKRIQLLGFGERPLLQIAYLPTDGKPAALCVLPVTDAGDVAVSVRRLENLSAVTWQRDGLSYVLAIDLAPEQAIDIGKKLAKNQFPVLFAGQVSKG
jgi:anti-sigma factor RsiW